MYRRIDIARYSKYKPKPIFLLILISNTKDKGMCMQG